MDKIAITIDSPR